MLRGNALLVLNGEIVRDLNQIITQDEYPLIQDEDPAHSAADIVIRDDVGQLWVWCPNGPSVLEGTGLEGCTEWCGAFVKIPNLAALVH